MLGSRSRIALHRVAGSDLTSAQCSYWIFATASRHWDRSPERWPPMQPHALTSGCLPSTSARREPIRQCALWRVAAGEVGVLFCRFLINGLRRGNWPDHGVSHIPTSGGRTFTGPHRGEPSRAGHDIAGVVRRSPCTAARTDLFYSREDGRSRPAIEGGAKSVQEVAGGSEQVAAPLAQVWIRALPDRRRHGTLTSALQPALVEGLGHADISALVRAPFWVRGLANYVSRRRDS